FRARWRVLPAVLRSRLHYRCEPVGSPATRRYDLVVAYGLLHCFRTAGEAVACAASCVTPLSPGGYLVVSCLTDAVPPGAAHPELASCHLPRVDDVRAWFAALQPVADDLER